MGRARLDSCNCFHPPQPPHPGHPLTEDDVRMKRVAIIGPGGSGKSALARQLGDMLGLEIIHLDALGNRAGSRPPLTSGGRR